MYIFKFKRLVNSITMWQKKEKTRQREIATLSESREGELVFHTKKKKKIPSEHHSPGLCLLKGKELGFTEGRSPGLVTTA